MTDGAALPAGQVNEPVRKRKRNRASRFLRLLAATVDPRAWAHLVKLVNYYNYTHVAELRQARIGRGGGISPTASFANARNIEIGDDVSIGANSSLWAGNGTARIVVGDHVLIAPSVMITVSNYRFNEPGPITSVPMQEADIVIGSDVWIGYGAVILAGTRIGDGAVIGAGAVVRGEVPPRTIVANPPTTAIGTRTGHDHDPAHDPAADGARAAASGVADADLLTMIAAETGRPVAALSEPIDSAGIDSFDLVTLRTALETRLGVRIPDREWSAIGSLAEIAGLPALTGGAARPAAAPPGPASVPASAPSPTPAEPSGPGRARRAYVLNMPQMALSGMSESWLFKEVGDLHWQLITEFLRTPSASIADEEGARLYATFTRLRIDVAPELRGFRENDPIDIEVRLGRYGASMYFATHDITGPGATARAQTMSTFAKYGERGRNTSLMKGTPVIADPDAVPSEPTVPAFAAEYRARRGAARDAVLFECDYDILSPHDINGVGLLYFAAYPTIVDLCLERHEGAGFLMHHSTVVKDVLYFANAEPDERLRFRLHEREVLDDGKLRFVVSLARSSDGARMAEAEIVKRPSPPPLPPN